MKKLRFFDSLKFVVAAIVCMFILNVAHADNTWKYTPIPIRYYANDSLVELTESDENFNTYTVKTTTTTANRMLYVQTENSLPANHKYFLNFRFKSNFTHRPYFRCSFDGGTTYESFWYSYTCRSNTWCNLSTIKTPQQDWQFVNVTNGIIPLENTYTAGETITIDKNGFLTVFDLTEIFGAGNEPATAADAERALSIDTTIKIATTKYNEEQFEPVKTDLSAAVNAVEYVVSNTMSQAQAIDTIATSKQTRPDEGCTAKYCLLVEDEDGTPHWYPIAGANGVAHNLPAGYTELQYIESTGTQYIDTGLKGTQDSKVDIDFMITGGNSFWPFGARTSAYVDAFAVWSSTGMLDGQFRIGFDNTHGYTGSGVLANTRYHVIHSKEGTFLNDILVWTASNYTNFITNNNLLAFAVDNVSGGDIRTTAMILYSLKLYDNNVLVRDFIPAKNASDVVGMYDMVSGQFFTNAGTGTFTAGPDM